MMKGKTRLYLIGFFRNFILPLFLSILMFPGDLKGQTAGTLTFGITTTEPAGGYTGKHVIALWLKDISGNFVKTKVKYAATRQKYLDQWINSSGSNVVDAITGATLNTHGTLTFTWDGTNTSGNIVPDGTYAVWMQMADDNHNGPVHSVSFAKSPSEVNLSPADNGNFTKISIKWVPTVTSLRNIDLNPGIRVFPTITGGPLHIHNTEELTDVSCYLYNSSGQVVLSTAYDKLNAGTTTLPLHKFINGSYYLEIRTGNQTSKFKVILSK